MMNFRLEQFKKLPKRPGAVWQGGVFPAPMLAVDDEGQPVCPMMVIWVDTEIGVVSAPAFVEDGDSVRAALEGLVDFGLGDEMSGQRPSVIQVSDPELATFLKGRLGGTGTRVERVDSVDAIQAVLDQLSQTIDGAVVAPGALTGRGVTIEHMRAFADAAARFYKAQLWDELTADDLICVASPKAPQGMGLFSVLGHDGGTFGLGFFFSQMQYEKMVCGAPPEMIMGSRGLWSLTFDALESLPMDDMQLWKSHELPVAGEDAFPSLFLYRPGMEVRRPSAKVLGFVTGLLHALAKTSVADLDEGQWTRKVLVGGDKVSYQLELTDAASDKGDSPVFMSAPEVLRSMEKHNAAIQRILADHEFETPEAANAFINEHIDSIESLAPAPQSPLDRAQEIVYDAWNATGRKRRSLARQALEICSDCADAYVILAEDAGCPEGAIDLYRQGVEAGERALGAGYFEENTGEFWDLFETRPYMRARFGLAQCLWALDRKAEAIGHYEALLRLNPLDNQGVRLILAACLLEMNDGKRLTELLGRYENERTAEWQYIRALWAFRQEGDSDEARRQAKAALASNRHVPDFLAGRRLLPERMPDSYQLGHEDEAVLCVAELGEQWNSTPGAVEWLESLESLETPQKTKAKRKPHRKHSR